MADVSRTVHVARISMPPALGKAVDDSIPGEQPVGIRMPASATVMTGAHRFGMVRTGRSYAHGGLVMRNAMRIALTLAMLGAPSLLSAQDVKTDFDKTYDFSKVHTVAVKMGTRWGNQLGEDRVKSEITTALVGKGWKIAPEESADAIAVIHGASQQKHDVTTFYNGMGGGWGYYGGGGMATSSTSVSEYTVGTLVVDIFDRPSKKLIFRGTATDELSDKPEKNQKKANKATTKMFKDFPPKPKAEKS
jgi:hypothetical protein